MKILALILSLWLAATPVLAECQCTQNSCDGQSIAATPEMPPDPADIRGLIRIKKEDGQKQYGYDVSGRDHIWWSTVKLKVPDLRPDSDRHPILDKMDIATKVVSFIAAMSVVVLSYTVKL